MGRYDEEWHHPVVVLIDGRQVQVLKTADALTMLQSRWPIQHAEKQVMAIKACVTAMTGDDPELAQASFIEAALDASILVKS